MSSGESARAGRDPIGALESLEGVGPVRAQRLARLGVFCIRDLLFLSPHSCSVWAEPVTIAEARRRPGERVTVAGKVKSVRLTRFGGRRSLVRITTRDATGQVDALFFNQPWMREHVAAGDRVQLFGRVVDAKGPALAAPKIGTREKPLPAPGTVEPEYPVAEGFTQEFLRGLCRGAVARFGSRVTETLPAGVLEGLDLPELREAVADAHAPRTLEHFERARRRLAFEPLLAAAARLHQRRSGRSGGAARAVTVDDPLHAELLARYPFTFTGGQLTVSDELRADLGRRVPMRRILQGDVGSGKTAVALYAAMAVAAHGGQTAFMAPTELLAEQHYDGLKPLLHRAGITAGLLTGSLARGARRELLAGVEAGDVQIVFGTHALFSTDVLFHRLDLAIIDEQHRFGVGQRAALANKGDDVHTLLMTATPIPRTLALTLYGDLEVSLLAEMPPGRGEVKTRWVRGQDRRRVPAFVHERLAAGEQVYWVCPRIGSKDDEDAEPGRVAAAERRFEQVSGKDNLAPYGVELVHGRMPASERAARLDRFRRGDVRMLVATTVIEVGVDVPAATVMVIENAERLGLAQLHQLRGRIGRSAKKGWCLLFGAAAAAERFELLEQSRDGFVLAEEDLKRRGMGDLAGLRQSGVNLEGLGDLERDADLLLAARDLVREHPDVLALYGEGDEPVP